MYGEEGAVIYRLIRCVRARFSVVRLSFYVDVFLVLLLLYLCLFRPIFSSSLLLSSSPSLSPSLPPSLRLSRFSEFSLCNFYFQFRNKNKAVLHPERAWMRACVSVTSSGVCTIQMDFPQCSPWWAATHTHTHTCVHTLLFFSFSDTRFPSLCVKSRGNIPPLHATIMCLFLCFVSSSGRRLLMTFDLCMVHFIFRVLLTLAPLPLNSLFFRFLPQYPSFFRFLSLFSCISYCSYFVFTQCCHNVSLFYIYIYYSRI